MRFVHAHELVSRMVQYGHIMAFLTEELLLLSYDDHTGRNKNSHVGMGLSGAMLLDLVLAQRIDMPDQHVVVTNPAPLGHGLLDGALQHISREKARKPKWWVNKWQHGLSRQVADSLVQQQVLRHDVDHILGFIPFNRFRPLNPAVESDARMRLDALLRDGVAPDGRTAALGSLVHATQAEKLAFPGQPRRHVRKALKAASESSWAADATSKAIEAAQAAVTASIAASAAAAAASNGGS